MDWFGLFGFVFFTLSTDGGLVSVEVLTQVAFLFFFSSEGGRESVTRFALSPRSFGSGIVFVIFGVGVPYQMVFFVHPRCSRSLFSTRFFEGAA